MPSNQLFNSIPSAPEVAHKPKKKNSFGKEKDDLKPKSHETNQALYKTELCHSFLETGFCRYAAKCQFAHGEHELRPLPRHMKYKTEICKTFHTIGTCPYGKRCRFIHKPREIQLPASLPREVPPLAPLSPTGGSLNDRFAREIPSPADSPVLTSTPVGSPIGSPLMCPIGSPAVMCPIGSPAVMCPIGSPAVKCPTGTPAVMCPVGSPVGSPIGSPIVGSPVDPAALLFLEPLRLADFEDLAMLPPVQTQSRLPIFASLC